VKLALAIVLVTTTVAMATPPEPKGAHPRMILDGSLRSAWKQQAGLAHGPVVGAIKLCAHARDTHDHDSGVYRGSEWVKVLQACLVAWGATDSKDDAATAIKFATALLESESLERAEIERIMAQGPSEGDAEEAPPVVAGSEAPADSVSSNGHAPSEDVAKAASTSESHAGDERSNGVHKAEHVNGTGTSNGWDNAGGVDNGAGEGGLPSRFARPSSDGAPTVDQ